MALSRRRFGAGLAGAVGLALVGGAPLAWFAVDEDRVFLAAVGALFPASDGLPSAEEVDAVGAMRIWVGKMPARMRLEVRGLLRAIEFGSVPGYGSRFTRLDEAARTAFLDGLGGSDRFAERLLAHGLKQLCAAAYWQNPKTWAFLGYDGPLVGRAAP